MTTRTGTIQDFGALVRARGAGARYAFTDRNMRLRATGVVHAVTDIEWLDGALIPAAKCGAATVGGPLADGVPTAEPVNCLRCLRGTPAYRRPRGHVAGQLTIPGLELIDLPALTERGSPCHETPEAAATTVVRAAAIPARPRAPIGDGLPTARSRRLPNQAGRGPACPMPNTRRARTLP